MRMPLFTLSNALAKSNRMKNVYGLSFGSTLSNRLSLISFNLSVRYVCSSSMLV